METAKKRKNYAVKAVMCAACTILVVAIYLSYRSIRYNGLSVSNSSLVLLLGCAMVVVMIISHIAYMYWSGKGESERALNAAFFAALFVMGCLLSFVLAPGTPPDEKQHFRIAYSVANWIEGVAPNDHAVAMRETDHKAYSMMEHLLERGDYKKIQNNAIPVFSDEDWRVLVPVRGGSYVTIGSHAWVRAPAALGIVLGHFLHLNGLLTFYCGRFFNLLFFAVLAWAAVKITPVGKPVFMGLSLLPMTLSVAASYSYDSGVFGLSFLLIALFLYGRYRCVSTPVMGGMLMTMAALAPCKAVYGLLVLLVFALPQHRFRSKAQASLFKGAMVAIVLIEWLIAVFPAVSNLAAQGDPSTIIATETTKSGNHYLREFIDQPFELLVIYANTIYEYCDFYIFSALGFSLGHFQSELRTSYFFAGLYGVGLLLACCRYPEDRAVFSPRVKTLFVVVVLLGFVSILASMLFAFTPASSPFVGGVQGRYFLPYIVLILLIMRVQWIELSIDFRPYLVLAFTCLNSIYVLYLLEVALVTLKGTF